MTTSHIHGVGDALSHPAMQMEPFYIQMGEQSCYGISFNAEEMYVRDMKKSIFDSPSVSRKYSE